MPFFDHAGERLYYEDSGGNGPPVLFSHGFALDHSMFDAQVAALANEFRCITWDERGHGMSTCGRPYTFWELADDALALLDHLAIGRVALVGMSQGGWISMRVALSAGDRVSCLTLIDTKARVDAPDVQDSYRETGRAWVADGPCGEMASGMAALIFGPTYDASTWIAKWQARPPGETTHQWRSVVDGRDDVHERLREIVCASQILHGTEDQAFSVADAEEMCATLAACEGVVKIVGAAHAPPVTHPDEVTRALASFLRRHAST